MRSRRLRPRDAFDWIGVVVDLAQMVVLLCAGVGLIYWYALKRLPAVTVANSVMLILLLGVMAWLAVKRSR